MSVKLQQVADCIPDAKKLNSHKHQQSGHIALESHIAILNAIEAQDIEPIKNAIEISVDYWKDLQFNEK